ncbi:DUF3857 domain-containing protein [bacterium SCSIO 12643]|nr:DUF3857 domain-containing protein [bacterium SCSIO 12643]
MRKHICSTLAIFFVSIAVFAQPEVDLKKYQAKYPGVQMVVLQDIEELHIENQKGELVIYETYYTKRQYLTKDAGLFRERQLSFSSFSNYQDLEASTFVPNGTKYKKIKTKEFTESDDLESGVFHDDSKIIKFAYQGLQMGAQSELSYRRNITDPHFLGRGFLQGSFPVEHQIYRVIVDPGVEMGFTQYQIDRDFVSYQKREEKGKIIYEWIVKDAPVIKSEKWAPNPTYFTPQVLPRVKSYDSNGETKNVFRDVGDLFNWYETLIDTLNSDTDNPMIQSIVDSIIDGSTSDLDRVKRVFEWTQENIKYVAYEEGLGGFIPRSAKSVCTNRFGDCKDMSSTITHLLKYAGIQAHLTWIGTNAIPFTYDEVPTPSVDNHMIATYIDKDGNYYFMDATGRYMPFGLPSSFIQGKQALIRLEKGKFELHTVPVVDPETNLLTDSVFATIKDGVFTGNAISRFGGYYKQNLEYKLEDLTEDEKSKFLKSYLVKGNNKFLPENFVEKYPYPDNRPMEVSYDFTIGDYAMTNENETYVNLNLTNYFSGDKLKKDRETPFQFKYIALFNSVVVFTIPDGYTLDYVPEPIDIENDLIAFHSSYKVVGNQVIYTMTSNKKKLNYAVSDVQLWNKSVNIINKSQKNVVILKKTN